MTLKQRQSARAAQYTTGLCGSTARRNAAVLKLVRAYHRTFSLLPQQFVVMGQRVIPIKGSVSRMKAQATTLTTNRATLDVLVSVNKKAREEALSYAR